MTTKELATTLKARRREMKMSQREFSKVLGITQPQLCKLEREKEFPRLKNLNKITLKLGFSIEFLPNN